ncbi:hypothetical protein [Salinibacterium sp.]|uniref:hypothetical protein n=1 Tax=Salinibacterium sp. TaxID=1915057 RepID=UPI00286B7C61|nr:hypothetical protein [Salinibacterium sp.]
MAELQADGVFEEAEGSIRQQLIAAAQLARTTVQARQDAAQRPTRRDLKVARQLHAQLDAQRVAARAVLAPVHNTSWWDQAQVRDIARDYEAAATFRGEDQAARDAESRIRQELRERYDAEVLETGADPAVVRVTLVDRDTERTEHDKRQAQARDDPDLAAGVVVGAEVFEVSADLSDAEEAQGLRDLAAYIEHDASCHGTRSSGASCTSRASRWAPTRPQQRSHGSRPTSTRHVTRAR